MGGKGEMGRNDTHERERDRRRSRARQIRVGLPSLVYDGLQSYHTQTGEPVSYGDGLFTGAMRMTRQDDRLQVRVRCTSDGDAFGDFEQIDGR